MYKLCKTEQSAARQRLLEEGLLSFMLTHRYEDITISDLCDHLGVPRKSFYRYFSNKDSALHALLDHRLMEYESLHITSTTSGPYPLHLPWFFTFWQTQRSLLDALAYSDLYGVLVERALLFSLESLHFDVCPPKTTQEYRDLSTSFIVSGLMSLVLRWHRDGYRQSVEEMVDMTYQLLSQPIVKEPLP